MKKTDSCLEYQWQARSFFLTVWSRPGAFVSSFLVQQIDFLCVQPGHDSVMYSFIQLVLDRDSTLDTTDVGLYKANGLLGKMDMQYIF